MDLHGRSLLKETDLNAEEFRLLVSLGGRLRAEKRQGMTGRRLAGRNIALIFEKTSTQTRSAFEVAAHDEGGHVTYLGPGGSQLGCKESVKDTARVLGRTGQMAAIGRLDAGEALLAREAGTIISPQPPARGTRDCLARASQRVERGGPSRSPAGQLCLR